MEFFVTSYGDETHHAGIIKFSMNKYLEEKEFINIDGKCNMCLINNGLYSSYQGNENLLLIIDDNHREEIACDYFYSYAYKEDNYLYLASFESGVDSLFDLSKKEFIKHVKHDKSPTAKSHYISRFKEDIISVDNGTNQLFVYDNLLNIKHIYDFENIQIRLISFDEQYLYLNTESSNELIVINENYEIVKKIKLTEKESFSAGNACNSDYIVISLRGENSLALIRKKDLQLMGKFPCGEMPRDIKFIGDSLLVACTNENMIQKFKIKKEKLELIEEIEVKKPITFNI